MVEEWEVKRGREEGKIREKRRWWLRPLPPPILFPDAFPRSLFVDDEAHRRGPVSRLATATLSGPRWRRRPRRNRKPNREKDTKNNNEKNDTNREPGPLECLCVFVPGDLRQFGATLAGAPPPEPPPSPTHSRRQSSILKVSPVSV